MLARFSLFTLILIATSSAFAQTPQPGWIADARNGCRVWNSSPSPNETITWSGACQNGVTQGRGVLQWFENGKPKSRYEGEFRDGKYNGRAVLTTADGNRYEGEFRDGKFNGRGVMTAAGGRYEGEFRDGRPNGQGTYAGRTGNVYAGTWTNGCFKQGDRVAWIATTKKACGFE